MNHYELLFIFPGTLSEDEVAPQVARVKEVIEQTGGQDVTIEGMGKSRLSYPMKHIRYGYFYLAYFTAESAAAKTLQDKLRLMREVLRLFMRTFDSKRNIIRRIIPHTTPAMERQAIEKPVAELVQEKSPVPMTPAIEPEALPKETKAEDIKLADIDKKLDELLETDIANV